MLRKILNSLFLLGMVTLMALVGCDNTAKLQGIETQHTIQVPTQAIKNESFNYSYFYGLSGYKYPDLIGSHKAKIMVVDVDDAELNASQLANTRQQGITIFSYLSIGEAEDYREYWQGWDSNKPNFLLPENKEWKGNYLVKFWDKDWQKIIISKAVKIAQMGFNGVYLDIVDGYQHENVIAAYPGSKEQLRQEMENFVIRISNATKKINPRFKIIPQNAVELIAHPNNKSQPNVNYLAAIDGMGVEDLWYDDDKQADWTKFDLAYIKMAQAQGKFILATSYPTDKNKQVLFVNNALKEKLIPFVGKRSLSKKEGVLPINKQLPKAMAASYYRGVY